MDGAEWLRGQLSAFGCAACGRTYVTDHIRVLAQREDLYFVDLACQMCGSEAVAIVTLHESDDDETAIEVGELADQAMTSDARGAASIGPAVEPDDVLDMHAFLGSFDGDFKALFRASGPGANDPARR